MKKLFTGLFRAARKRLMTTDNDLGMFRTKLNELVENKDKLSDEEISAKVEELKGLTNDLPDGDEKAKLDRFLDDFNAVKDQDAATAKEAASMVSDVFEKLDTAAMKDVPATEPGATDSEPAVKEEKTEEVAEETKAPAKEAETKDEETNQPHSLEEIYQFIRKRMDEDKGAEDSAPEETEGKTEPEKEVTEEKEDEVVADHAAPTIPVTMNSRANKGSLGALFESIKRGER